VLAQSAGVIRVGTQLLDVAQWAAVHPTPAATPNSNGYSNAVVTNLMPAMALWHTESFGPVLVMAEFDDEAEAVRMANVEQSER
jgi:acyl-CoA reductase-like NAD-dependent aldehyde dehydrogenase